jgi:aspartyl-tRNA synthetase
VVVNETQVLNRSDALPFSLNAAPPSEEVRLKYR